ncbi:DUF3667 domain-containing protein [Chondrinema litorale]|uniref:DUF3667 domain-containing protein n=1 Tax=Chondrinema litorale TaxID=2994555 RepID=UPI002543EAF5|nr:DUF3667 domain-containing protein [Chondrinema litorale]UZR99243.1 DUF3667 domain-containing protein [Chondrinema litorale]
MNKAKKCSVCQTDVIGLYCYNCGQKITGRRLSFKEILAELTEGIFSIERSLIATFYHLLIKPKQVVENYWAGNRNYYYSPVKMLTLALFVIGIHLVFVDKDILGVSVNMNGISKEMSAIFSPQLFFMVLMLPLISFTTYITYFKQKHNALEHLTSVTYLFAFWAVVITVFWDLLELILGNPESIGAFALFSLGLFIWTARIFTRSAKWYRIVLNTLAEFFIFCFLIISLVGILYLFDPNTLDVSDS